MHTRYWHRGGGILTRRVGVSVTRDGSGSRTYTHYQQGTRYTVTTEPLELLG